LPGTERSGLAAEVAALAGWLLTQARPSGRRAGRVRRAIALDRHAGLRYGPGPSDEPAHCLRGCNASGNSHLRSTSLKPPKNRCLPSGLNPPLAAHWSTPCGLDHVVLVIRHHSTQPSSGAGGMVQLKGLRTSGRRDHFLGAWNLSGSCHFCNCDSSGKVAV
jgi:hypothetical protein